MRGKQIKVEILLGAVLVLVAAGAGGMLVRPGAKPDQTLKARFGDVVWNHDLHARMPEIATCTVCHHTERQGITDPKPCGDCHTLFSNREAMVMADLFMEVEEHPYEGEQGPPAMEIFHNKCLGCHKAMRAGPAACRDCHAQTFSAKHGLVAWDHRSHARGMNVDCVKCHHKDTGAAWDGEYRGCRECHAPASVMGLENSTGIEDHGDKLHGRCHTCHTVSNPENDLRSCTDCHKGMRVVAGGAAEVQGANVEGENAAGADVDEAGTGGADVEGAKVEGEAVPPSREEAVHRRCKECHNPFYRALQPSMPIYCADCHKPDPSLITDPDLGPVLFSHERHAEYERWTCDRCHHTDVPGEPHMACYRCHGTGNFLGIPDLQDAMYLNCLGCHYEEDVGLDDWNDFRSTGADLQLFEFKGADGGTDGATGGDPGGAFWWDHRFHAVGMAFSCRDCHHNTLRKDGAYVTALRTGKTWTPEASRIQNCRSCHGLDGPVAGSVAEGTGAAALEGAYRKICIQCHQRFGAGPLDWAAFFKTYGDEPK